MLLFEEGREGWSIVTAARFGECGDRVVVGLVMRELSKPGLGKMPQSSCCVLGVVCCASSVLARNVPPLKVLFVLGTPLQKSGGVIPSVVWSKVPMAEVIDLTPNAASVPDALHPAPKDSHG